MPMRLSAEDLDLLHDLAAPLDRPRREAFMTVVAAAIEEATAIGPGVIHRIARSAQRQFYDPPVDTRAGEPASRRRV
jgi:hypothetical protein